MDMRCEVRYLNGKCGFVKLTGTLGTDIYYVQDVRCDGAYLISCHFHPL